MIFVYQNDEQIGRIEDDVIVTEDATLQELFDEAQDEGVPVASGPNKIAMHGLTPDVLKTYLEEQGYEVEDGEKRQRQLKNNKKLPDKAEDANVLNRGEVYEIEHQGLAIHLEQFRGDTRHGDTWQQNMTVPYGYIVNTEGADGDEVDCFVGPIEDAPNAYVIHTKNRDGEYDEDKVMLGFGSALEAQQAFLENYDSPTYFDSMERMSMGSLKQNLGHLRGKKITHATDAAQFEKSEVEYEDPSTDPSKVCMLCKHFDEADAKCELVKGYISADAWCKKYVENK